ncbi:hypothetical protein DA2_2974 [Desulfovibrio sp. A2]|nr:hypothetical protein DA2_2974 [Desulfovibrio sp. A2]
MLHLQDASLAVPFHARSGVPFMQEGTPSVSWRHDGCGMSHFL